MERCINSTKIFTVNSYSVTLENSSKTACVNNSSSAQLTRTTVLLATANALLITDYSSLPVRLLIDSGSELTFIANMLVKTCHLTRRSSAVAILGIGITPAIQTKGVTTVKLKSTYSPETVIVDAHILQSVTGIIPTTPMNNIDWPALQDLQLAYPDYATQRPIDILIGAYAYGLIIKPEIRQSPQSALIAQNSIFGWILVGPTSNQTSEPHQTFHVAIDNSYQQIKDLLLKFWVQEEIPEISADQPSQDDQLCEDHYMATHSRDPEGMYIVRIPLKASSTLLGNSIDRAQHCLKSMLRRLANDDSYSDLYHSFMREYEDLQHMTRASTKKVNSSVYYLPHHGVLREDSTTTKLRVVFNGSSPSSTGFSVNDIQHVGAKVQRDISDVLLWIRQFKYIFTTDITKMYRQIKVHEDDWDLQRILWIDDEFNVVPYQLTTVTYGTRSTQHGHNKLKCMIQLLNKKSDQEYYSIIGKIIRRVPQSTLHYPLTPQEIDKARIFWVKSTQESYFSTELKMINSNRLPSSHPFSRLTAYIDTQGNLRVGGRLANSSLNQDAKHPAILPQKSYLSQLIIADAHERTMHGGTQVTLNHIRSSYWIIGGRIPVRSFIFHCIKCARQRGERAQQLMGQLPTSRATPSRPFAISGVDYAGPLSLKTWKGRGAKITKGWICIFVCFITSAVHIEVVSDYSADSFIAAFRRFTGRRGICKTLHSDCGTTFKGADTLIRQLFIQETQEFKTIAATITNDDWKYIQPAPPYMGGKWEAAVKSVKHHLTRTTGDTIFTYEELTTLLIQVEAILNSRPLEPLTEDPADLSVLTPSHFLIGESIATLQEPSLEDDQYTRLSRWQLIQQRLQFFLSTWSRQYLQQQLSISKWKHPTHNIKVGSGSLLQSGLPPESLNFCQDVTDLPG